MKRNYHFLSIIIGCTLLMLSLPAYGQNMCGDHSYRKVDEKYGLITSRVYSLFEDELGQLYAGTDKGLFKYNGRTFQLLGEKDNLNSNFIYSFHTDSKSRTWLCSYNGAVHYIKNDSIHHVPIREDLRSDKMLSYQLGYTESSDGTIYIGSQSSGYVIVDNEGNAKRYDPWEDELGVNILFPFHGDIVLGNSNRFILQGKLDSIILSDIFSNQSPLICRNAVSKEHIFVGKKDHLKQLDKGTLATVNEYKLDNQEIIHLNHIDTTLYIGTHEGLYIVKGDSIIPHSFNMVLAGHGISHIIKNHLGEFVISTLDDGIYIFSNTNLNCDTRLPKGKYMDIIQRYGNIYFSSINGQCYSIDKDNNLHGLDGFQSNAIDQYLKDYRIIEEDTFYINRHSINVKGKNGISDLIISLRKVHYDHENDRFLFAMYKRLVCADRKDFLYISHHNGEVQNPEANKFIQNHSIANINTYDIEAFNNEILVTGENNLYRFTDNKLVTVLPEKMNARMILQLDNDYLVVSTFNQGALILDSAYNTIATLNPDNTDMCSYFIKALEYDEESETLYMLHDKGYSTCKKDFWEEVKCLSLANMSDNIVLSDLAVYNDNIFITTSSGLISTNKKTQNKSVGINLNVYSAKTQNIVEKDCYKTETDNISLQLRPMVLDQTAVFQYIYNVNDSKSQKSKYSSVTIHNLRPGDNIVYLNATSDTGLKTLEKKIIINYTLPWYKNKSIWIGIISLLSLTTVAGYRSGIIIFDKRILRSIVLKYISRLSKPTFLIVKLTDGNYQKINMNTLQYVKASGNYLELVTEEKTYCTRSTLKDFATKIKAKYPNLIQVHRSYMANSNFIDSISFKKIFISGQEIPYTDTYKSVLKEFRKKLSIQ